MKAFIMNEFPFVELGFPFIDWAVLFIEFACPFSTRVFVILNWCVNSARDALRLIGKKSLL